MTSSARESKPLLSICIPTYNGASFLKINLQALLPQVSELNDLVEVLVVDDASTDNVSDVICESQGYGPVKFVQSHVNTGMTKNYIKAATECATGEFVWILSQHCLIYPGALNKLCKIVSQMRHLDAFCFNFRCAQYPEDWPQKAVGGYTGPYRYLACNEIENHHVKDWSDLLLVNGAIGTQSYSHILKRSIWISYWAKRSIAADFMDAPSTYATVCTAAENMFGQPSYYIGEPVMTIFNNAQTWGSLSSRSRVYLRGHPDLLCLYERLGWSNIELRRAQASGAAQAYRIILQILSEKRREEARMISGYVRKYWRQKGVVQAVCMGFIDSKCCWMSRFLNSCIAVGHACGLFIQSAWRYLFYDNRIARRAREHLGKK